MNVVFVLLAVELTLNPKPCSWPSEMLTEAHRQLWHSSGSTCLQCVCCASSHALTCHAYLCQGFVPDAHICKVAVQAGLGIEASTVAVLVLPQYQ